MNDIQHLPQSPDAEKGILCSFLISPLEVGRLCADRSVGRGHFFLESHAIIYSVLLELWSESKSVDFIILTQILSDRNLLTQCGGAAFVTELFTFLPTAANASYYLEIIEEKKVLREIITICNEHSHRSYSQQDNFEISLSELRQKIAGIGLHQKHRTPTMMENVKEAIEVLNNRLTDSPNIIKTGLEAFDKDVGPMERGNLLVIGGQTKSGKSIVAGQIALNIAMNGKPVLYISLEMSERELTMRWLSAIARVNVRIPGAWKEGDFQRFTSAQNRVSKLPATIITRRYQLSDIVGFCQEHAARSGEPLACIVLDYAQLAHAVRNRREDRRQQEIAEISRTCKRLAGSLNVFFILLTQLNDEGRSREARDIEHDANLMVEIGHNKESGARAAKVVLARSAPMGQRLRIRIIPEHTRVEDDLDVDVDEKEEKKNKRRRYEN